MTPKIFTERFWDDAKLCEQQTGVPAEAVMAQAAVESGWGEIAPGNMFFGIKDTDGVNGNEQLLTTTEYSRSANASFPNIISVTPVLRNGQKYFKYKIKDYFRKYDTPAAGFADHAKFFLTNPRYAKAMELKGDYKQFIDAIAHAGYATDPNYAKTLKDVVALIIPHIPK